MSKEDDEITYGAAILLFEREYRKASEEHSGTRPGEARKAAVIALMKAVRKNLAEAS